MGLPFFHSENGLLVSSPRVVASSAELMRSSGLVPLTPSKTALMAVSSCTPIDAASTTLESLVAALRAFAGQSPPAWSAAAKRSSQLSPSRLSKPGGITGSTPSSFSPLSSAQREARRRNSERPASSMLRKCAALSPGFFRRSSMMMERESVVSGNLLPFRPKIFGCEGRERMRLVILSDAAQHRAAARPPRVDDGA